MSEDSLPWFAAETVAKMAVSAVPFGGPALELYEAIRERRSLRAQLTVEQVTEAVGIERLVQRVSESAEFEALLAEALDAAIRSGLEAKRRLLAKAIVNAATDDARLDESQMIVQALRDLDAPQIRALERIRLAEDQAAGSDPTDSDARQAMREAANQAGGRESEAVVAVLVRTGVVAPPSLIGGGIGVAYVSDFGRRLLDSLRSIEDDSDVSTSASGS